MKIIIVGGGVTGCELARRLIKKKHDVTLIEKNCDNARHAANRLDCMVLSANGNDIQVLLSSGIKKADVVVTVTDSDELNLIICGITSGLSPHILKIARVRQENYATALGMSNKGTLGVDILVYPDEEVAHSIMTTIEHGAISEIINFNNSKYDLTRFPINPKSALDGSRVQDIRRYIDTPFVVVAVEQETGNIIPNGNTVLKAGDRISVLTAPNDFAKFYDLSGYQMHALKKIAIVGMDEIGYRLANGLHERKGTNFLHNLFPKKVPAPSCQLIIVEKNEKRAKQASADFPQATVYNADITDENFIDESALDSCDLVITTTKHFELNMISSAYLKTLGVFKTIAVVQSALFENIAHTLGIDLAVSFKSVVVDSIMSHLAGKNVTGIHTVGRGSLEIIEFIIPEDSLISGKSLKEIGVQEAFLVLLLLRGNESFIPIGDTIFEAGDKIVFISKVNSTDIVMNIFGVKQ